MDRKGTYLIKNVPSDNPIAILNAGKEDLITYLGDSNKKSSKVVLLKIQS